MNIVLVLCADDIPIQEQESETRFDSIAEDQEWTEKDKSRARSGSALKHLPTKLVGLSKKAKMKNSPTPPRHSLENEPSVELRMAAGDQIGYGLGDSPPSDSIQTVHVSTV